MVTICTTSLTFNNSTFCPHSVFMCFVWIWEQTAIISLYNINWLVFITETGCVYCAVRTGSLNKIHFNAACHHGAQIRSQAATWEVCCGKVFLGVFRLSPDSVNPPLLRVHVHGNINIIRKTSGRNLGDLKSNALSETWERWVEIYGRRRWNYEINFRDTSSWNDNLSERCAFIVDAFAELRKTTIRCVMSERLSAWNNSTLNWRILLKKFNVWVIFENLSRKFKFH